MSDVWVLPFVLQWIVVGALCLVVLSLLRQVGELRLRVAAGGGFHDGDQRPAYATGRSVSRQVIRLEDGRHMAIGGPAARPSLVVFVSPGCVACDEAERALPDLVEQTPGVDCLLVYAAEPPLSGNLLTASQRGGLAVALGPDFPSQLTPATTPYALSIDSDGIVAAGGPARTREDVERVLRAVDDGGRSPTEAAPSINGLVAEMQV